MWTDYSVICCTGLSEQTRCTRHAHRTAHQLPASLKIHRQSQIFLPQHWENHLVFLTPIAYLSTGNSHPTQLHGWPSVSETPCSSNKVGATVINQTVSTIPGPNMAAKPTAPEARLSVMFLYPPCTQPVILPQLLCPFASHST